MLKVLFVTWDGSAQSYYESLFLPLLGKLRAWNIEVHALQLTWGTPKQVESSRRAALTHGVGYTSFAFPTRIRKLGFPALAAAATALMVALCKKHKINVLMPRSILPSGMALAALPLLPGVRLLYESDGLMADERADFAGWSREGTLYRALLAVEAHTVRKAHAVTTRTRAARDILLERGGAAVDASKLYVIPNAKDPEQFPKVSVTEREQVRSLAGVAANAPWVLYIGSIGPQYRLREMLEFFAKVKQLRPDARFHIATYQPDAVHALPQARELSVVTTTLSPKEVPTWIAAADVGLAFRTESLSQQGVAPIKVVEYMQGGLPAIASPVGDLREQLGRSEALRLISKFDHESLEQAARWFVEQALPARSQLRDRCTELASSVFSFEASVKAYGQAIRHAAHGSPSAEG